ncbi:MAG: tetratricopeptide repeat-containing glycosyltransferase family protein [Chthoniobacteraceae bacterium]
MVTITVEQALQTALAYHQSGQLESAGAIYRQILRVQPQHPEALHSLGLISAALGQQDVAAELIAQAIVHSPAQPIFYSNLGEIYRRLGRLEESIACFQRALALHADLPETFSNYAAALAAAERLDEAIPWYHRALAQKPGAVDTNMNLGVTLVKLGRFDEAVRCFERVVKLDPDFRGALGTLGVTLLLLGNYEAGWRCYEGRRAGSTAKGDFPTPRWDGGPATGRTILIHAEQGFGDTIQFFRYVPLIRQYSGASHVIFECQPELVRLLSTAAGRRFELIPHRSWNNTASPPFDLHLALLSLPLALQLFEPLQVSTPYLFPGSELRGRWRARLSSDATLRVGIAWEGSPTHNENRRRSIDLSCLLPVLSLPHVTFYSLQPNPVSNAASPLTEAGVVDVTDLITDFADTAALIVELDLVISVDTAVAHLAGALDRPVWTLLAFVPDWRWGLKREDTPWYPTMRLFRQPKRDDWDSVIHRVAEELTALATRYTP